MKTGSEAPKCATCGRKLGERETTPTWPFCSERCRLVDLGKWLGEEYRIAGDPVDGVESSGGSGTSEDDEG